MSFLYTCIALLVFIFIDILLTSIRPTWSDGGDIAHYVLVGLHVLTVILQAVVVFVFFSSTIWFAAGLLGQLFFTLAPTLPLWVLRFVVCYLPWVYKRFIADNSDEPWSNGVYGFLVILDILSCICLSVSLFYTMCCMTDKHMYVPYHTAIGQQERDNALAINAHGVVGDRGHGGGGGGGGGLARGQSLRGGMQNPMNAIEMGGVNDGGQGGAATLALSPPHHQHHHNNFFNEVNGNSDRQVRFNNDTAAFPNGVANDSFARNGGGIGLPPLANGRSGQRPSR